VRCEIQSLKAPAVLYGVLITALLWTTGCATDVSKVQHLIFAEADSYVSEHGALSDHSRDPFLQAGIGQAGGGPVELWSYIRFDLSGIQQSSLFTHVEVESAELRLLAQTIIFHDKVFSTVSYCADDSWQEVIQWHDRPCQTSLEGQDSTVIELPGLPRIYDWNLTRSVASARRVGSLKTSLVVTAFPLYPSRKAGKPLGEIGPPLPSEPRGFVRF